jgi:hypothetical protein
MSHEESVSYFKRLENLEKIRCTNVPNPSSLPVNDKKSLPLVKGSLQRIKMLPACGRAIAKFKQQKKKNARFEAKAGPGKKSLAFLFFFEDIHALKRQLKEARRGKRKAKTTSNDKGEE